MALITLHTPRALLHCQWHYRCREETSYISLGDWSFALQVAAEPGVADPVDGQELVAVLSNHYRPKPSEIVQRFRFHSRFRKAGESVAAYMAELRAIAEFCNFGAVLEDMLRDRLVCGVNDELIRRKLLAEKALTYQKALTLSQGLETAAKNILELKQPGRGEPDDDPITNSAPEPVHKLTTTAQGSASELRCHRCGMLGHLAPQCMFKDATCHRCGKQGHLRKVCRSKPAAQQTGNRPKTPASPARPVHCLEEEEEGEVPPCIEWLG